MRHLSDDERRELLGAYALDALEPDEQEQIDELLLHDAEARAELHTLQLGASWLSESALRPPEHVWEGITSTIAAGPASRAVTDEPIADVTPIKRSRARRPGSRGIVRTGPRGRCRSAGPRSHRSPTAVECERGRRGRPSRAGHSNGEARGPRRDSRGRRRRAARRRAYLVRTELPPLKAGRTYQLWAVRNAKPDSVALLGRHAQPRVFSAPKGTTAFAVSVEPTGGSKAPTTDPVIQGAIE